MIRKERRTAQKKFSIKDFFSNVAESAGNCGFCLIFWRNSSEKTSHFDQWRRSCKHLMTHEIIPTKFWSDFLYDILSTACDFHSVRGVGYWVLSRYGNRCIKNETECATCCFDEFLCVFLFSFAFLILLKMQMQINADLNICRYLCLHMKICRRFHITTPFKFWDMRKDMWKVCLQTFRNNKINIRLLLKKLTNLRILKIKKVKFSGYCFYMNTIIGRFSNLH